MANRAGATRIRYPCPMALATVRPAVPSDVAEIARIQADTWAAAYAAFVPEQAVAQLRGPEAQAAWTTAIEGGRGHVLLADEGAHVVGFCAAAALPAREDDPLTWGEIGALLVEPRWGRRGHGGRLLAAAAQALREDGARYGLAWVPEPDEASRRFYARAGWEPDGAVRGLDTGTGELREIRITGSLDLALTS